MVLQEQTRYFLECQSVNLSTALGEDMAVVILGLHFVFINIVIKW